MILKPNSIEAISWGLQNFDGSEFDVRISRDDIPVIHHDTYLENTDLRIQDLNLKELRQYGIQTLEELLINEEAAIQMDKHNKILWLELKPDCIIHNRKHDVDHANRMYRLLDEVITNKGKVSVEQINVFSFDVKLLLVFKNDKKYRVYPIIPDIDECDSRSGIIRQIMSLPKFFKRSVIYHGNRFKKMGFNGMLFPHQYVTTILKPFHPSFNKAKRVLESDDFLLITNTEDADDEEKYNSIARFTDLVGKTPRTTGNIKNQLIIHRGCGTEEADVN